MKTLTTKQITALRNLEFGSLDDYFPPHEIDAAKQEAWDADEAMFFDALERLIEATDETAREHALDLMSRAERAWGDDPVTREARAIIGAR